MVYSIAKSDYPYARSGLISKSFADEVANHLHIEKTASEQKKKAEEQKRLQQKEQSKQKRKQELISKYGEKFGTMINERKVAIGMTTAMCKESVGYPSDTYSVTTSDGVSLVWVYYGKVYLYFYNNVLYRIDRQS